MTPKQLLRYQLALLLASNGQDDLLAMLSDLLKLPRQELLDALLVDIERLGIPRAKQPKTAIQKIPAIDHLAAQYPEKADLLRTLNARLENKTLFAELRDVRRFLENHSVTAKSLKSRANALPKLLKVLATLEVAELKVLCESPSTADYSSLGIISDQILRRDQN